MAVRPLDTYATFIMKKTLISTLQNGIFVVGVVIVAAATFIAGCNRPSQSNSDRTKNDMEHKDTNDKVWVRYIVADVDKTVEFYTDRLGFQVVMHPGPGFAQVSLGNLNLLVNKPAGGGGAGQSTSDGESPTPGGWNRIQIRVSDLEETVKTLRSKNAEFKGELIAGNGGKQILLLDPSGNLIELFESYDQKP